MATSNLLRITRKLLYIWAKVFFLLYSFIAGLIFLFAVLDMIGATHFGYPLAAVPISAAFSFLGLFALHLLSKWRLEGTFDRVEKMQRKVFDLADRIERDR